MKIFNKKTDIDDIYPLRVMAQGKPDALKWWVLNAQGVKVAWAVSSKAAYEYARDHKGALSC